MHWPTLVRFYERRSWLYWCICRKLVGNSAPIAGDQYTICCLTVDVSIGIALVIFVRSLGQCRKLAPQYGDILLRNVPHNIEIDISIPVDQDVSHSFHIANIQIGMFSLKRIR